ncbi:MAG TPA: hypothetical protein VIK53_02875 [Verrucomicrobiae bacterium]
MVLDVPENLGYVAEKFWQLTENVGRVTAERGELPEEFRQLDLDVRFALMR